MAGVGGLIPNIASDWTFLGGRPSTHTGSLHPLKVVPLRYGFLVSTGCTLHSGRLNWYCHARVRMCYKYAFSRIFLREWVP